MAKLITAEKVVNVAEIGRKTLTYKEVKSTFHSEKMRDEATETLGVDMQYELNRLFRIGGNLAIQPKELQPTDFEACYDPALPTIAIDPDTTFSGTELLGLAAHEDDTKANLIFVSAVSSGVGIKTSAQDGSSWLEATHGALVLPTGQVAYGELPYPVKIDAFESSDIELLKQCASLGIATFNTSEEMDRYSDKHILDSLTSGEKTYAPPRLTKDELFAATNTDNLVIKPSKNSQGRGVLLTDANADVEHTKRYYQFLEDKNYEPVIEKRARSYEMIDPETGNRLDWNVRALLSYGDLVGMYIRADNWGEPVNMSLSAKAISLEQFPDYFSDKAVAQELLGILHDSAQSLAEENPASFIGADLTIDEDKRACVFELNNGHAGGMQTIALLKETYDGKMAAPRRVLGKFIDHTVVGAAPTTSETTFTAMDASLSTLAPAVYNSTEQHKLGMLAIDEVPHNDSWRFGTVLALVAIHNASYIDAILSGDKDQESATEILYNQYPLEARRYLPDISAMSLGRKTVKRFFDLYDGVIDDDAKIALMKAKLSAEEFDIEGFYAVAQQAHDALNVDTQRAYRYAQGGFMTRFVPLLKEREPELLESFSAALENAVTTYCDESYEAADAAIMRRIEKAGFATDESRLLQLLRFSLAASTKRYDKAQRCLRQCQIEYDTDDSLELDEYLSEHYIETDWTKLKAMSAEALDFQVELAVAVDTMLITASDILYGVRTGAYDASTVTHIARTFADKAPFEGADHERETLFAVVEKLAESTDPIRDMLMEQEIESMSELGRVTAYLAAAFGGQPARAKEILDYYSERGMWINGMDCIYEVYVAHPEEHGLVKP